MIVVLIFAWIAGPGGPSPLQIPGLVLVWMYTIFFCAVSVMLFTVTFFGWPDTWNGVFSQKFADLHVQGGTALNPKHHACLRSKKEIVTFRLTPITPWVL